jgi:hypothetical protein
MRRVMGKSARMIRTSLVINPDGRVSVAGAPGRGRDRRRLWWAVSVIVAALLLAGGMLLPAVLPTTAATTAAPVSSPSPPGLPVAAPPALPPTASATSKSVPEDLLTLPGAVPTHGSGRFVYAPGRGRVLGAKGPLRRFRVAVEQGSNEAAAGFAAQVEATLGDNRSWVGDGQVRLQRVPGGEAADFTVFLATRDTAGRMCRIGGVTITVAGRPYTSCRTTGRAIINLDRWRLSARPYLDAKVPLTVYRQYVVNHEVGHELGRHHEGCPKRGGPAPVMVQQTLTLRGCVPYAWPRRDGRRFEGPPV